jgi:hypothetical protein
MARVGQESLVYRLKGPLLLNQGGQWCGFWRDRTVIGLIVYWDKRPYDALEKPGPKFAGQQIFALMRKQETRIRASR